MKQPKNGENEKSGSTSPAQSILGGGGVVSSYFASWKGKYYHNGEYNNLEIFRNANKKRILQQNRKKFKKRDLVFRGLKMGFEIHYLRRVYISLVEEMQ